MVLGQAWGGVEAGMGWCLGKHGVVLGQAWGGVGARMGWCWGKHGVGVGGHTIISNTT